MRYIVRWTVEGIYRGGTGGYVSTARQRKTFTNPALADIFAKRMSVWDPYFGPFGGETTAVSVTPERVD